jgi:hypothetical protein
MLVTACPVCTHVQPADQKFTPCVACGYAGVTHLFRTQVEAEAWAQSRGKNNDNASSRSNPC